MEEEALPIKRQTDAIDVLVREIKPRFVQVASEETFIKEANYALQAITSGPAAEYLRKCDKQSIQNAVLNIAMTGATLNPIMQQAFLIPRKGKCCLDFSYRGLIKLAIDSGSVLDIDATVVHEKDEFQYEMGLTPKLRHVPSLGEDPGEMRFVYAVAILLSGIKKFIVLNRAEIEKIRKASQMPNGLMWKEYYDEGCRKTAIKKLYKMLPQTDKLSNAIMVVNQTEGFEFERLREEDTNAKRLEQAFHPAGEVSEGEIDILPTEEKPVTVDDIIALMVEAVTMKDLNAITRDHKETVKAFSEQDINILRNAQIYHAERIKNA